MAERSFKERHGWRALAGGVAGVVIGIGSVKGGAPAGEAMVLGWQTGTFVWGLANGLAEDLGGKAAPIVVGGAVGAELALPPDGPLAVTGPAAGGWVLGAIAKNWPSKSGPKK